MQSWMALLVAGILMGPVTGATVASAETPSVPSATRSVVDAAYAEWQGGLGARRDCSSGVTVVFEEIDGRRGEYRTGSATVVIGPSDDVAGMASIVVHELSYHTFLACGAFADTEFSAAFYAAQGIPAGRDWFDYSGGWAATPAEHFAEAAAVTILGSGEGGIAVTAETRAVMSRWLSGAPVVASTSETYEPVPYASGTVASTESGGTANAPDSESDSQPEVEAPVAAADAVAAAFEIIEYSKVLWQYAWRVI